MKKFVFPLESALKVRGLRKKMAEKDVMTTSAHLNKTVNQIEENEQNYLDSFSVLSQQTENLEYWRVVTDSYQKGLRKNREDLEQRKGQLEKKLDTQKKTLANRMKDERVLERLKEKQVEDHKLAAERELQLEMEELDLLKRGGRK